MKLEIDQEDKDKILSSFGKEIGAISWRNNLVHARYLGFKSNDPILDMKNYLRYINRKKRKEEFFKSKAKIILENYGYTEKDLGRILMSATKNGFEGNKLSKIKQYLKFKEKQNDNLTKSIKLHKEFCKLYNLNYRNEQSFSVIIHNACRKLNLDFDSVNKALESQEIINYFSNINGKNHSDERNQLIAKILKENNINLTPGGALMTAKRDFGLNYKDNILVIKEFVKLYNERLKESSEFQKRKDQFMIDHNLLPENWRNNLVNARAYGFKSNDPFKDLEEFFLYIKECKLLYGSDLFYKSKTKEWIKDNQNKLNYIIKYIIDKNNIFNSAQSNICGIYCWLINDVPYYIGQSTEISNRSLDHIYNMYNFPEWWLYIIDNVGKNGNKLEIKVLEVCEKDKLDYFEEKWIKELKPISQFQENKTTKYDSIIPLKLRNFNLQNLVEKYKSIGGTINEIN